ncbi:MAG: endonuclease MutS2 [Spirochaetales bacterium]|nr:endonuclease MutS2 [Spirochaetales bacterium]
MSTSSFANESKLLLSMPPRTIHDLEFDKISNELSAFTLSREGRERILQGKFIIDKTYLRNQHQFLEEIFSIRAEKGNYPGLYFPDIHNSFKKVKVEGSLVDGEELYNIGIYLNSSKKLRDYYSSTENYFPEQIVDLFENMPDLSILENTILNELENPGKVSENHPKLRPYILELERARKERHSTAEKYVKDPMANMQGDQAVYRDGRIVLPFKSSERNFVKGVMHGSSGTGATLFIEPYDLVEKNNKVTLTEQQILIEIQKILRKLTEQVRDNLSDLLTVLKIVGEMDSYLAKAEYAAVHHCKRAEYKDSGIILKKARHPILREKAVPIDVELDPEIRAMIMSGPNAGGKTVTLKTIGLFVLMNQFGMYIPADEGCELPLFHQIFTDIGDEQSIEDELSTFSGHMKHISEILHAVADFPQSLLIFDELGSGTDPVQGSALARSILEYSSEKAGITLITSHHSVLKQYAYAANSIINASMEFDEVNNIPTYRVITGLPGESYAIETAERMRMPKVITSKAKSFLTDETVQISSIIKGLEERKRDQEKLLQDITEKKKNLQEKIRNYDLKMLQVKQYEHHRKISEISELGKFTDSTKKMLENLVRELKEGEITRTKTLKMKAFIRELDQRIDTEREMLQREQEELSPGQVVAFYPEMDVRVGSARKEGKILKKDRKGFWVVLVDAMKITFPENEIFPIPADQKTQRSKSREPVYQFSAGSLNAPMPVLNLDVRGKTLQEALSALQKQFDNAIIHNMLQFSVIHGKGDGILQRGIHNYLHELKEVDHFAFARPEEGGYGKTHIYLSGFKK